jgi:2-oxoisovalerate dehydrogenase E2 component (dihydrolipoyl transacylase)
MLRYSSLAKFRASSVLFAKLVPYLLADIGEGILEVEVKEWFVKPGDVVKQFQPLCEVQSDKATVTISSRYEGIIKKLYIEQNAIAKVGAPIVDIETDAVIAPSSGAKGKVVPSSSAEKTPTKQPQQQQQQSAPSSSSSSSSGQAKIVPYLLADIGEGILEVEVKEWFVKPGDVVKQFQPLCEVQSDKATVTISSRYEGVIRKLYVPLSGIAKVGAPIVDIETTATIAPSSGAKGKASSATTSASSASSSTTTATNATAAGNGGKALCPPSVRRIAAENNINLALVPATGKGGRVVTKEDILNYIKNPSTVSSFSTTSSSSVSEEQQQQQQQKTSSSSIRGSASGFLAPEDKAVKITGVKRIMVQSMTKANNIPAFGNCDEIEISNLMRVRKALSEGFTQRHAIELQKQQKEQGNDTKSAKPLKLSFMPFFLKAASLSLSRYPDINAHTNDDCTVLTLKGSHNLGFAMDTPQGLIVPVVRDVQAKSLYEIAVDLHGLMQRTASGTVAASDLQGATFTLSNIGSIGATYTVPVINPPQVAIGAIGRGRVLPRFDAAGNIVKANIVEVSWAADHRVVDGATMVRFGNSFKDFLENPELMLGYMR